jgi:TM2 domain-containing membrane protein YozV
MFCKECGVEMSNNALACPKCGEPIEVVPEKPDNVLATVLNLFVPGLGQMIQGRVGRGIGILAAFILLSWTVIGAIAIYIWAIVDAYKFEG